MVLTCPNFYNKFLYKKKRWWWVGYPPSPVSSVTVAEIYNTPPSLSLRILLYPFKRKISNDIISPPLIQSIPQSNQPKGFYHSNSHPHPPPRTTTTFFHLYNSDTSKELSISLRNSYGLKKVSNLKLRMDSLTANSYS